MLNKIDKTIIMVIVILIVIMVGKSCSIITKVQEELNETNNEGKYIVDKDENLKKSKWMRVEKYPQAATIGVNGTTINVLSYKKPFEIRSVGNYIEVRKIK